MIPKEERENVEENSAAGKEMREQHTVIWAQHKVKNGREYSGRNPQTRNPKKPSQFKGENGTNSQTEGPMEKRTSYNTGSKLPLPLLPLPPHSPPYSTPHHLPATGPFWPPVIHLWSLRGLLGSSVRVNDPPLGFQHRRERKPPPWHLTHHIVLMNCFLSGSLICSELLGATGLILLISISLQSKIVPGNNRCSKSIKRMYE